ncbi:hypothetical protein [Corynebacterium pelargi]|uniref:hypothetical protein n=1 Tax=Corynebacterium pelargi TaxID=1471400 RepID=UPI0016661584|nr:hypothetical protein [Corynebacterium pelargi]
MKLATTVDEVDDLHEGGFANRVLCIVGTFDDVQSGMELDDRAWLVVAADP